MSLDTTVVEHEWSDIDVLVLNKQHKLAVIIENKLQSGEHDNQLDRYYRTVQRQYPDWRILALYLTIDGASPSDGRYLPISYADAADIVGALVVSRETVLGPDVRTLMQHYVRMIRRNIVSDAELDELCHQIYQKHKRAIDLINARRPDKRAQIIDYCKSLIEARPEFRLRTITKTDVGFHPIEWDIRALQYCPPEQARSLIFQFFLRYETKVLTLIVSIRPGRQEVRQRLFDMALAYPALFKMAPKYIVLRPGRRRAGFGAAQRVDRR
jgi:PD-(D/E)XK nuclease superfamily